MLLVGVVLQVLPVPRGSAVVVVVLMTGPVGGVGCPGPLA